MSTEFSFGVWEESADRIRRPRTPKPVIPPRTIHQCNACRMGKHHLCNDDAWNATAKQYVTCECERCHE